MSLPVKNTSVKWAKHQDQVPPTSGLIAVAPKAHLVAPVPHVPAMVWDTKTAVLLIHGLPWRPGMSSVSAGYFPDSHGVPEHFQCWVPHGSRAIMRHHPEHLAWRVASYSVWLRKPSQRSVRSSLNLFGLLSSFYKVHICIQSESLPLPSFGNPEIRLIIRNSLNVRMQ